MDMVLTANRTITSNDSQMDSSQLLESWNDEEIRGSLGVIVFLSLSILLGVIGNGHVLFIYMSNFRKSKRKLYFVWLGWMDLLTCVILIPFTLFYVFNKVTYQYPILCKFYMFWAYFFSGGSGFLLLVVTIDRYKAICTPTRTQMTTRTINIACGLVLAIWTILIIPSCVLYGQRSVRSDTYNVTGFSCECQDGYDNYYKLFRFIHLALFVIGLVVMYSLYGRALFVIVRHKSKFKKKTNKNTPKLCTKAKSETNLSLPIIEDRPSLPTTESSFTETSASAAPELITRKTTCHEKKTSQPKKKQLKARRLTIMFIILTFAVTMSWMPYYVVKALQVKDKEFYNKMPYIGEVLVRITRYSYFVSNVVNPIIYSLLDPSFKAKLLAIYRK